MFSSENIKVTSSREKASRELGGVSNKVMAQLENGQKVMIKESAYHNDDYGNAFAEKFSYHLGCLLGICVNRVEIINNGECFGLENICSVHFWENDLVLASDISPQEYNNIADINTKIKKKEIFDRIIANGDRHSGNYGYVNGDIFLIDNGLSKPYSDIYYECDRERYRKDMYFYLKNDEDLLDMVKTFVSLSEDDIKNMGLPQYLINVFESLTVKTIKRMKEIQEIFRKALEDFEKYKNTNIELSYHD